MKILESITKNLNKPIFLKTNSLLEDKLASLKELKEKGISNAKLDKDIRSLELGIVGEKEIEYELRHANFCMYILRDIVLSYENLKAQIDYIIITPAKIYYIECKNLYGNISINERGDFIREYTLNNKKVKEGIYSPIRQAERHLDIVHKRWSKLNTSILKGIQEKNYYNWNYSLVVVSNSKSILNTKKAPKEYKDKIIKSDQLLKRLKDDIDKTEKIDLMSQKRMHDWAQAFLNSDESKKDTPVTLNFDGIIEKNDFMLNSELRGRLLDFRRNRSKEKKIPAYYVFNNEEMEQLIDLRPKSIDDLIEYKILTDIKIKAHGKEILKIINR